MLTVMVSAHAMSDTTPYMSAALGDVLYGPAKHALKPYMGLVPMSPKTTPSAASDRGSTASCTCRR